MPVAFEDVATSLGEDDDRTALGDRDRSDELLLAQMSEVAAAGIEGLASTVAEIVGVRDPERTDGGEGTRLRAAQKDVEVTPPDALPVRAARQVEIARVEMNGDAEAPRDRRLIGDEETRLLATAGPHLRALIEAALTTGLRRGELLSMQWKQVKAAHGDIIIPAAKAKTATGRTVPLAPRLAAVLDMRKHDPDGQPFGPDAFVFGNEVGERVKSIKTAWSAACRRAGITDLHFHDLRRECGSRWHEAGISLVQIQAWLGHTNIAQTSTYLRVSLTGAEDAKRALATAPGFAHVSHKTSEQPTDAINVSQTQTLVM